MEDGGGWATSSLLEGAAVPNGQAPSLQPHRNRPTHSSEPLRAGVKAAGLPEPTRPAVLHDEKQHFALEPVEKRKPPTTHHPPRLKSIKAASPGGRSSAFLFIAEVCKGWGSLAKVER